MSGAGWVHKNDVRNANLLIENKRTDNKKSITIKSTDLIDLWHNAVREGRMPVLQFDLNQRRYVILTEDDFLGFISDDIDTEC